jgi:hypothetical protein
MQRYFLQKSDKTYLSISLHLSKLTCDLWQYQRNEGYKVAILQLPIDYSKFKTDLTTYKIQQHGFFYIQKQPFH